MPIMKHEDYVLALQRYLSDVFPKLVSYQPHPSSYSPVGDFHSWLGGIPYGAIPSNTWQISTAMEKKLNLLLSPHYKTLIEVYFINHPSKQRKEKS
jgi:hypothetical protein